MSFLTLVISASLAAAATCCPVSAPCHCKNVTNPYTLKLEYIADCSKLGLVQVPPFVGGEKVDRLLLNMNNLTSLSDNAFRGILPSAIDLSMNALASISSSAFIGLEDVVLDLNLGTNQLNLPLPVVQKLMFLETLNLDYNPPIRRIFNQSFYGLASLKKLVLSRSHIDQFDCAAFQGLNSLTDLDFYGNNINAIPTVALSVLTNLESVNYDSNAISDLEENAFQGLANLKQLQLSRNQLTTSSEIHPFAFKGLDNLETLGFYYDKLGTVPNQTFPSIKGLKKLDLSFTSITSMPPGTFSALSSLQSLDISGTRVKFEEGMFMGLENTLQTILIRYNGLDEIPSTALSQVPSLDWVDAAANTFSSPLPANFAYGLSIKRIGLMWMNISAVSNNTFAGLQEPLMLEIFSNDISSLDFVSDPCQYNYVSVTDNPIMCDCHVYNLTMAQTTNIEGTCDSPPKYKGLQIGGVQFQQLAKVDCQHYNITGPIKCPWS